MRFVSSLVPTPALAGIARIIVPLALALSLAACSAVKFGYNNAGDLAYWWLDGYVDFTEQQAPRVREDLARLHEWHRVEELPRLEAVLARMEKLAGADVQPEQACAIVDEARQRLEALAERAEPAVVALALALQPAQLKALERKNGKNNADYRKEWLQASPAEQKDKRAKQIVERSEMIYGSLEEPQRAAIRRQVDQSAFDARLVLAERQRRQQDLLATLRRLGPATGFDEARRLMRGYLDRVRESPDPRWRAHQQALIEEGCRAFAAAHNTTTPAQRETAVRRLRAYARDLRDLAARR